MKICQNPILSGFYPDPSICRVGEDYYMVNSTFAYFPGIPVFHSRDLAAWEQIGNVLDRNSQIPLKGCGHSEGIYAPAIRYDQGIFYVIATNISGGGNFIVTARDPAGPWSEPFYLGEQARGIDPSLFFEEDGSCYYIGQRENSAGSSYFGDCEIWIEKLNRTTMKLEGGGKAVLYGFQKKAVWPEGPHLYKKDGYYYILHAEGGTEKNHCVMIARSRSLWGPYEYAPTNPILTHRHLGKQYPVTCVGHSDLVEDSKGSWYMVALACRPQQGYTLMGRETFLAKVSWEDGWPVVNPGVGRLETQVCLEEGKKQEIKELEQKEKTEFRKYTFGEGTMPCEILMLRNPGEDVYSLKEHTGFLRLFMKKESLAEKASPAYAGVRQKHHRYEVETAFWPAFDSMGDCAGMAVVQSNESHVRMECARKDGKLTVCVIRRAGGEEILLGCRSMEERKNAWNALPEKIGMKIAVNGLEADFFWKMGEEAWHRVAAGVDIRELSTERAGGFTGCTAGMYASANGAVSKGYADFEELIYRGYSGRQKKNEWITR